MDWDWEQEQEEYERYLRELERKSWDRNSLARMEDRAFEISIQLRRFLEFSDRVLRRELAGSKRFDQWAIWREIQEERRKLRRIDKAPLSRWLGRVNRFSECVAHAEKL